MSARVYHAIRWLPVVCLLTSLGGCATFLAGGAAGAAGYAYTKGGKTRYYAQPVAVVAGIVPQALQELEMPPNVVRNDATGAVIKTVSATGKKVKIEVKPRGSATQVAVRVGTFGNEAISHVIFSKLDQHMNRLAAAPASEGAVPTAVTEPVDEVVPAVNHEPLAPASVVPSPPAPPSS